MKRGQKAPIETKKLRRKRFKNLPKNKRIVWFSWRGCLFVKVQKHPGGALDDSNGRWVPFTPDELVTPE